MAFARLLEDDLRRLVLKGLAGKPTPMSQRPMTTSIVDAAMAQQERKQLLAFAAQIFCSGLPRTDQIAHGLVHDVRHPHCTQLARPMQPRQRDRIPSVRLDPLARALWDQGRRNHHAIVAEIADLPIKSVTRRTGFKTDVQAIIPFG